MTRFLLAFLLFLSLSQLSISSPLAQLCLDPNTNQNTGVETAIGCLYAGSPNAMIGQLLGWAVIVGAGIAFLLIVYAGFQIATAAGDPKRVQAARELLTSAVSGLLLIIFSLVLLNFIGIKILNIENLGFRI